MKKVPQKNYNEIREHFIQRLKERYNIELSEIEYDNLLKSGEHYTLVYRINTGTRLVWFKIKNKDVLCIYKAKDKGFNSYVALPPRLVTCLNPDGKFPCPQSLLKKGYDKEIFEKQVNETIKQIHLLSEELSEKGKKQFFINNHNTHPILKNAAYIWVYKNRMCFNHIVQYIEYKIIEKRYLEMLN